ncbi:CBS domain-containing protein [Nakamurella deserti]|uniref:CBS domain-containing protein n=1 Tax=Nakamurella deserti TaxID=2164074 RepID=UPI000DBE997D|nr:CBS domain-containing protein [Nakamurella deserti]
MPLRARDIMTGSPECAGESDNLVEVARKMRDLDVGALPICGDDGRLTGMITDRDIVVRCIADGGDPSSTPAGSFGQGKPVTIGADDPVEEALATMAEHQVRRLPVIDGMRLVGIISEADIAQHVDADEVGETVGAVTED